MVRIKCNIFKGKKVVNRNSDLNVGISKCLKIVIINKFEYLNEKMNKIS